MIVIQKPIYICMYVCKTHICMYVCMYGFSDFEMEFDSAIVVSWAISSGFMGLDFAYLFSRVWALAFSPSIIIKHVF